MSTPNRESLANGLVVIGEEAVAKSNEPRAAECLNAEACSRGALSDR
jgi:hypothetical protein